jgi:nucleoside-diphosphate-sugar epimerase
MDDAVEKHAPCWLVFGLSGQVGGALQAGLAASDPPVLAVSRVAREDQPGVTWRAGALDGFVAPVGPVAAIASLGPLDAFATWFEQSQVSPARVVALGSTSVHGKADSPDPAERDLALTLRESERRLAEAAAARGAHLTVLRPTLLYGTGRDRNLSRLVALARRLGWLPLPFRAAGLRQPVHVADVAGAVLHCLRAGVSCPGFFNLPGGETLPFDQMVRRALEAGAPRSRLVRIPGPLFRAGVRSLRISGRLGAAGEGVLARLDRDLAYDLAPAREALGYAPRGFQPDAAMFPT